MFIGLLDAVILYKFEFSVSNFISNKSKELRNNYPFWFVIFLGPFFEEIIFRLPLKISKRNTVFALIFLSIYFIGDKLSNIDIYSFYTWLKFLAIVGFSFIYFFKGSLIEKLNELINKYHAKFIILSSLLFGLVHVFNFTEGLPKQLLVFIPFYVMPLITLGFVLSYQRMKNGFLFALIIHCLYNFIIYNLK